MLEAAELRQWKMFTVVQYLIGDAQVLYVRTRWQACVIIYTVKLSGMTQKVSLMSDARWIRSYLNLMLLVFKCDTCWKTFKRMQQNQYIFLRSDMSVYTYFYFAVILKKIFDDQRIKLVLKVSFESNVNMLMLWSLTPPSPFPLSSPSTTGIFNNMNDWWYDCLNCPNMFLN